MPNIVIADMLCEIRYIPALDEPLLLKVTVFPDTTNAHSKEADFSMLFDCDGS